MLACYGDATRATSCSSSIYEDYRLGRRRSDGERRVGSYNEQGGICSVGGDGPVPIESGDLYVVKLALLVIL